MKVLRIIRSLFIYSFMVISLAITIIIASYFALFSRSKTQPFQTAARIWGRLVFAFTGTKILVSGCENIPRDKAVFFVSNHQSYVDDILILACVPINFRVLIAKEYFKLPVYGWGWKKAGYIPVIRKSPVSFYTTFKKTIEAIKAGESILIFPEGSRSKTGELGEFKHASLMPALKTGVPIVPIAISGSFNVLPPSTWIIHPHPVKFSFGKPIYIRSEAEYDEKLKELRETIARML